MDGTPETCMIYHVNFVKKMLCEQTLIFIILIRNIIKLIAHLLILDLLNIIKHEEDLLNTNIDPS